LGLHSDHEMARRHILAVNFRSFSEWCREGESNPQDPKVGGF
jgi:hypothetical protein